MEVTFWTVMIGLLKFFFGIFGAVCAVLFTMVVTDWWRERDKKALFNKGYDKAVEHIINENFFYGGKDHKKYHIDVTGVREMTEKK